MSHRQKEAVNVCLPCLSDTRAFGARAQDVRFIGDIIRRPNSQNLAEEASTELGGGLGGAVKLTY
jgi:hypothetical protein